MMAIKMILSFASQHRFLFALGAALLLLHPSTAKFNPNPATQQDHSVEDARQDEVPAAIPEEPTAIPDSVFLIMENGDRILLDRNSGTERKRRQGGVPAVVQVNSPESGIVLNGVHLLPGLDGDLICLEDRSLKVSIEDLVRGIGAGFLRVNEGVMLRAQKQISIFMFHHEELVMMFGFDAPDGLEQGLARAVRTPGAAFMVGLVTYTITSQAESQSSSWCLVYTDAVAVSQRAATEPFPELLYSTFDSHLYARHPDNGSQLWRTQLDSIPAFAMAVMGDDTFKIPIRYCVERPEFDSPLPDHIVSRSSSGQTLVLSNQQPAEGASHAALRRLL